MDSIISNTNKYLLSNNSIEEAILENEPIENSYNIISPNYFCKFPYIFLGRLKQIFISPKSKKKSISLGIGILIGDDIVLTTAHNLYLGKDYEIIKIEFIPLINGNIELIKPIICKKYVIPRKFEELKKENNINDNEILQYDYGICFLNSFLGREIVKMFELENEEQFKFFNNNRFFKYFIEQSDFATKLISSFDNGKIDMKISMISYIKFEEHNLNDPFFKYGCPIKKIKSYFNKNHSLRYSNFSSNEICTTRESTLNGEKNKDISISFRFSFLNQNNLLDDSYYILKEKQIKNKNEEKKEDYSFINSNSKFILCEVKGKGFKKNNKSSFKNQKKEENKKNEYELDYLISTYCGQSGSPIFARIKNKNYKNKHYDYILIGIHSRSSPQIEPISYYRNSISYLKKSIISSSGFSQYNIGLFINNNIHNDIIKISDETPLESYKHKKIEHLNNHIIVKCLFQYEIIFLSLFPKIFPFHLIFSILSNKYFAIPEDSIFIDFNNILYCYNEVKYSNKLIENIIKDDDYKISFNIHFNYGKIIRLKSMKIIEKINEISGFNSLNKKKKVAGIVWNIHSELKCIYYKNNFLYSLLYNEIQKVVMNNFLI